MSIGSLILRLRQTYAHGLRVAYFRDVVRPRILKTAPIRTTDDSQCELHVMTSSDDWLNLIWTLKSFYVASKRRYRLCIHEDGSVPPDGIEQLQRHFPAARLVRRTNADARVLAELSAYPRCQHFRKTNLLSPKVFDFTSYLEADRMLCLDSDLLFFKEPLDLLQRIEDPNFKKNVFNADFGSAYTVTAETAMKYLGLTLRERINSGLGLVHRGSMRWDWIEEFLGIPGILQGHFWRVEQTLIALSSCRFGVELLPEPYALFFKGAVGDRPFRHYVGRIRHLMYREGMPKLLRLQMIK